MKYNFTNINKTNNYLFSPSLIEYKKRTMTYVVGNPGPGLGQPQMVCSMLKNGMLDPKNLLHNSLWNLIY